MNRIWRKNMQKLLLVVLTVAIAIASCGVGLKGQINGKWEQLDSVGLKCTEEYVDNLVTFNCNYKNNNENVYNFTNNYEITSDNRIVYTSDKGVKNIAEIKINGDEMQIQNLDKDRWIKYKRIK